MSILRTSFIDFQNCLIAKIEKILSQPEQSDPLTDEGNALLYDENGRLLLDGVTTTGMLFEKADGTMVIGATGYRQQLPLLTQSDEDPDQFFPYFIVRIVDGKTPSDNEPWDVSVDIIFGVFSDDTLNQGHVYVSNMIEAVSDYFAAYPLLDHKYRALRDMNFVVQDEDTAPYYFGLLEMKFWVQKARREDPYA